jgi:ActR/RegA family two-component response regulator
MPVPHQETVVYRPCLILAHADAAYAAQASRAFRRLGWDVYVTRSGPETRRLARMLNPSVVVLEADLPEESGWLTCDKLVREQPLRKVILVGVDFSAECESFAAFIGAAGVVNQADGVQALVDHVCDTPVHAAS